MIETEAFGVPEPHSTAGCCRTISLPSVAEKFINGGVITPSWPLMSLLLLLSKPVPMMPTRLPDPDRVEVAAVAITRS